jgi:hypothetical protein
MSDYIIINGDQIQITVPPPAVVQPAAAPITLVAKGMHKVMGQMVCVDGDEVPPPLMAPMLYTSPPYVTPGTGKFTITLTPAHKTMKTKSSGKPMLLKGAVITASFDVVSPAMLPTPAGPQPDPMMKKPCTAQFITKNVTVKAT